MTPMALIQIDEVKVYLPGEERDVMNMDVAWHYVATPDLVVRETLEAIPVDGTMDIFANLSVEEGDTFTGADFA
jgi:hypothetical protein